MIRNVKRRGTRHDFIDFSVDHLEDRKMLAGSVAATLAGGSLTISGDSQDNFVAAFQVNGDLALVGIDTAIEDADMSTSLFGVDFDVKLISGVTRDVTAILRGGDDAFLLGGSISGLEVEGLLGTTDVSFGPAVISRDLNIYTNGGRDTVLVIGAEIGRDLKIDTGFGLNDTVIIGGGGTLLAILDALDQIDLGDLGDFRFGGLPGDDGGLDIIGQVISTLTDPVEVGRDLRISGESSDDLIYVGGAEIGRDAIITSNIGEDNLFFGTGAVIDVVLFDYPFLGIDDFFGDLGEFDFSAAVSVGRNALLSAGDGDDISFVGGERLFEIDLSEIDPSFLGEGFGFVFEIAGGVSVDNNLTIDLGNQDDLAYIGVTPTGSFDFPTASFGLDGQPYAEYNVYVGRDMFVLAQADDDGVQIGGTLGEVSDAWWLPRVEGVLQVERNLLIDTGAGTDELLIGDLRGNNHQGGNSSSEGDGSSVFYQVDVGQNLTIRTGWHDDNVYIAGFPVETGEQEGGYGGYYGIGNLRVGRDMNVDTDGGNDNLYLGVNEETLYGDSMPALLGASSDSEAISIGRNLRTTMGDQDDLLTIDFTSVGKNVTINSGWGRDNVLLGSNSFKGESVSIGQQLRIDGSLERDTISIENSYVGGRALINTGLRDDDVLIRDSYFGSDLRVITGAGNDTVTIIDVTVDGQLRVDTQSENDEIEIHNVYGEKLLVLAGAHDDQVCVVDCMFTNGATLNGGTGEADAYGTNLASAVILNFEDSLDCGLDDE